MEVGIDVTNRLDHPALFWIPRHDDRAGLAAFEQPIPTIEQEAAFDFLGLGAVAFVAVVGQNRADFVLEELGLGRGEVGAKCRPVQEQHKRQDPTSKLQ